MRRERFEPARPYGGRNYYLVRAGCEGTYWRAAEGMEIRLAAAEREHGVESEHPALGTIRFMRAFRGVLVR